MLQLQKLIPENYKKNQNSLSEVIATFFKFSFEILAVLCEAGYKKTGDPQEAKMHNHAPLNVKTAK